MKLSKDMKIKKNECHIWTIKLDLICNQKFYSMLSKKEKSIADKFYFKKDRNAYIISHFAMKNILSNYLSIPLNKIEYKYTKYKKPFLDKRINKKNINFNLSHSKDLAILGVALNYDIGIDIEKINKKIKYKEVARNFFSRKEIEQLEKTSLSKKRDFFFNCWTKKESYLKFLGNGILSLSNDLEISVFQKKRTSKKTKCAFFIYELNIHPEYKAAVTLENNINKIHIRHWN